MLHSDQIIANAERALAGVPGGYLLIYRDGLDVDESNKRDRQAWGWKVMDSEGMRIAHGTDLYSPWHGDEGRTQFDTIKAMRSFIHFLLADLERAQRAACVHNEPGMFSTTVSMWTDHNELDLTMLSIELGHLVGEC